MTTRSTLPWLACSLVLGAAWFAAAAPVTKVPVPGAADAADLGAVDPSAAVAAAIAAPQRVLPVRPPLSSKAELSRLAGVAPQDMQTPAVLSLARQRVGKATLTAIGMSYNNPDDGAMVFDSWIRGGVVVKFDSLAGHTYVVECSAGVGDWQVDRYDRGDDGNHRLLVSSTQSSTAKPSLAFTASEAGSEAVAFVPETTPDQPQAIGRCQVARADAGATK